MRILLTGAGGNVGRGIAPRLRAAGHTLVRSDIDLVPDDDADGDESFVQCDVQTGVGLETAAQGCDLLLHTPAWHGVHSRAKTEADFWRLNVDGLFWALQAARTAGVKRLVFLSSMSWHGHYDKYGFTKRVGEELVEYHRRNHGVRYVIVRPHDFTPWGTDWLNRYGARLLYGGVDREDVLDCIEASVGHLDPGEVDGGDTAHRDESIASSDERYEGDGLVVNAVRHNAFTDDMLEDWEADPLRCVERLFPGSRELVERHSIDISRRPTVVEPLGAETVGYAPRHDFGTFIARLRDLDDEGADLRALTCHY
jgi:NAD dependent epimerase/dehydratase family